MIRALLLTGVGLFGSLPDGPEIVQVGHWLQVRGRFDDQGRFVASRAELISPQRYETIIGTVGEDQLEPDSFTLLGQPVHVGDDVDFSGIEPGKWAGKRIKLEGRWRNERRFSAREIQLRKGSGRERLEGRVDAIQEVPEGRLVRIMRFEVLLPRDLEVRHERPVEYYPLSEERGQEIGAEVLEDRGDDLDDLFGGGIALRDDLRLFGQISSSFRSEKDYNLDNTRDRDRGDASFRARLRLHYLPLPNLLLVAEGNATETFVGEETSTGTVHSDTFDPRVGETFAYLLNVFGVPRLDLQVGRQDFDDEREWLYDQNLDGIRLYWTPRSNLRIETSFSTLLGGSGSPRDRNALNTMLYVSNNDSDRHLAAYALYRDVDSYSTSSGPVPSERQLFFGGRVLGDWLPANKSWLEFAHLAGDRAGRNVSGFGYDLGTTWFPPFLDSVYLTLGYALGTGEGNTGGTDNRFRQTGIQDNNARFGGVSSFRYYGEILDPELSNIGILTAGIGTRFWDKDASLDLVFHDYTLDVVGSGFSFRDFTDLSVNTLVDADVGWELDLILGMKAWKHWDMELTTGYFKPGAAFPGGDEAVLARFQLRYRF